MGSKYITIREIIQKADKDCYFGYGIAYVTNNQMVLSVSNISKDKNYVDRLSELCNQLRLSPIHLGDIAEDAMLCS